MYLSPGLVLQNRYEIRQVLGQGGFGITYLAWDRLLSLSVAIKEYLPRQFASRQPQQSEIMVFSGEAGSYYAYGLEKFLEEARALARFAHLPGIVAVRDYFAANRTAYMVMEYLDGQTLQAYLEQRGGRLPWEEALRLLTPVFSTLAQIHATGLLHRDISPDNIYLTAGGQVKLLDFGAARYFVGEHSRSLSVILKPGYAPEEQYRSKGRQGPWTDVYACAATLYRAITGQTPPDALDRLAEDTLVPPSRLGVAIPPAAEQGLLVRAEQRLPDLAALQQALTGQTWAATTVAPQVLSPAPAPSLPQYKKRRVGPTLATVLGVAVLMIIIIKGVSGLWRASAPSGEKENQARRIEVPLSAPLLQPHTPALTALPKPLVKAPAPPQPTPDPHLARTLREEGRQYYKQGKFAEAIDKLEASIRANPNDPVAHYLLGWSYHQLDRSPDLALAAFQNAIRLKPDYTLAYDGQTWTLNKLGRYAEAVQSGKKTVSLLYNFPDAHYNLGMAYLGLGQKELAIQQYQILLQMNKEKADLLLSNITNKFGTYQNYASKKEKRENYYFAVIASFSVLENARNYIESLKNLNIPYEIELYLSDTGYYEVTLGGYLELSEAQKRASYAKERGISPQAYARKSTKWGDNLLKSQ
jgi:serine/threonine protein kinase